MVEPSSSYIRGARGDDAPDPESLANELDALKDEPASPLVADKLSLLASRCQWVRDSVKRDALLHRIKQRWPQGTEAR
jgi:hypothetical protein